VTNFQTDSILENLDLDIDELEPDGLEPDGLEPDGQGPEISDCSRDLPLQVPSITNSPRCAPSHSSHPPKASALAPSALVPGVLRRVRKVRVDAWAVPASANWSRPRTTIRKVTGRARSTDWALPF